MSRYLLDTDVVIDYLAGVSSSVRLIQELGERGDVLCTCGVVIAELFAGVHAADRPKVQRLVASFRFLAANATTAEEAGEWRYRFARQGKTLSTTDCLIAATARFAGATLVTGNVRDYPMEGVVLLAARSIWPCGAGPGRST